MLRIVFWLLLFVFVCCGDLSAATLYVDLGSSQPEVPYNSWLSAATNIQDAVNVAVDGDDIIITNGHYLLDTEIIITNAVSIRSFSGPEQTIVDGQGSVRCFKLENVSCVLDGITITNGFSSQHGAGVFCAGLQPVVTNCLVIGNSTTRDGGGMYFGTANNCVFSNNESDVRGGGFRISVANNCLITGNESYFGGGMSGGTANNCTITGNSAKYKGGGVFNGTINNCIVWYNQGTSEIDLSSVTAHYSCSVELSHGVDGNITNMPMLISYSHIADDSPCRGAGSSEYILGTDLYGESWQNPPSMGCEESGGVAQGSLSAAITAEESEVMVGLALSFSGVVEGASSCLSWNFGDGSTVSNVLSTKHAWGRSGIYDVILTVCNDTWPNGVSATQTVSVIGWEDVAVCVAPDGDDANDGLSWATAKATIQAGVDAQNLVGGWVFVSNGTYSLSQEIAINKDVVVKGLNGPDETIVAGQGSVRCFNLGNARCIIEGLTISNGYAESHGGGVLCDGLQPVLTNCVFVGNSAEERGGGLYFGTANNCVFLDNSAGYYGGGASDGVMNGCVIRGNYGGAGGGGAAYCTAINCLIEENRTHRDSFYHGGGVYEGTVINCVVTQNSSGGSGGGLFYCTAYNSTITRNVGGLMDGDAGGGGVYGGAVTNCVVWYNQARRDHDLQNTEAYYTCSPDVTHGVNGNITHNPLLVSVSHLAPNSPCYGAGSDVAVSGTDIDGEAWNNPPSMGCDELGDTVEGPLQVRIGEGFQSVVGQSSTIMAEIDGSVTMHVWDFGDGTRCTNTVWPEHVWDNLGDYSVILTAYNESYPDGLSATQTVRVVSSTDFTIHVAPDGSDGNDGLSWSTAKATLQEGIYAQIYEGGRVLVSNGTYFVSTPVFSGSYRPVVIQSLNGPEQTIVDGQGKTSCFQLSGENVLSGFSVVHGYGSLNGAGGLSCGAQTVVTNCIIRDNSTRRYGGGMSGGVAIHCVFENNSADRGGALYNGKAYQCVMRNNSAGYDGGGVYKGVMNNCTIVMNSAEKNGGGVYDATVNNSVIWYNHALVGQDLEECSVQYSCSPDVDHGVDGNITNAPMLVSFSHLEEKSPCRGAGSSELVSGTDIDGEAWLNPPSMGCDEFTGRTEGSLQIEINGVIADFTDHYTLNLIADIDGALSSHIWDFGDGTMTTNMTWVDHVWSEPGDYPIILTAFSDAYPDGVSVTQMVHVSSLDDSAVYVSLSGNDANDGLSWATAKASIQAGVDLQDVVGGLVWVSNGTYALSEEIVVSRPILVQSVAGPDSTIVNGQGTVRCFNLNNAACVISGLTITNGYDSSNGGGVYCLGVAPVVENCVITGNEAKSYGGGMYLGSAYNTRFFANAAGSGGGKCEGIANDCLFVGNDGYAGGGMYFGTANNCTFRNNTAWSGGGVGRCIANYCEIVGNKSDGNGGGAYESTLNYCSIRANEARAEQGDGGGVYGGTANQCALFYNSARVGGGMSEGTANNCTIAWNKAVSLGGGDYSSKLRNCIVWYNDAPVGVDLFSSYVLYSCSPDATNTVDGNITNAPLLITETHVAPESPCRGAGSLEYVSGTDIDGEAWLNPPSMGCDEYTGLLNTPVNLQIECSYSNVIVNQPLTFFADIDGGLSMFTWDMGDGLKVTNQLQLVHKWESPGTYPVVLTVYNDVSPGSISVTQKMHVVSQEAGAVYVSKSGNDANDGLSWSSAKASIQAGVNAQHYAGGMVCVSNGTYGLTREIRIKHPVVVQGVGGAQSTIVDGRNQVRCFNLDDVPCVLSGLTITRGFHADTGGGVNCAGTQPMVTNCIIRNNRSDYWGGGMFFGTVESCLIANNSAEHGGGMFYGVANNSEISGNSSDINGGGLHDVTANYCIIRNNSSIWSGGGIFYSTANNCILTGNTARNGGGLYEGAATNCTIVANTATSNGGGMSKSLSFNCIVWGNKATYQGNDLYSATAQYTCSPDVTTGVNGNIKADPMFEDAANGNFRLQGLSPCVNVGDNSVVSCAVDAAGLPRVIAEVVDMGAYEYLSDGDDDDDGMPDEWELNYFGSLLGADAHADPDHDSIDTLSEWIAGTDPTRSSSCLTITNCCLDGGFTLEWCPSVTGRLYRVVWIDSLSNSTPVVLQDDIVYPQNSYTDLDYNQETNGFYRVEVRMP